MSTPNPDQPAPTPGTVGDYVPILGPLDERAEPRPLDEIIDRLACVMGRLDARKQWYDYGVVRDARQLLRATKAQPAPVPDAGVREALQVKVSLILSDYFNNPTIDNPTAE